MNIAYVFDDNYAECASVSIISLLENNKNAGKINLYIFGDNLSKENKIRLDIMCAKYEVTITYIDVQPITEKLHNMHIRTWRSRYSAYIKLMLSEFLPEKEERLIVIDADTVVIGSIIELSIMSLNGHPCAMALEGITGKYRKIIGLGVDELYNTGVIVYDLKVWKEKNVENRILKHLEVVYSEYLLPEEDPISLVLRGDVERLPAKYNYIAQYCFYSTTRYFRRFYWSQLKDKFYSLEEVQEAGDNAIILHCIDTFTSRPWYCENINPFSTIYDSYRKMTPWKDIAKRKEELNVRSKIEYLLRKYLPKKISNYLYFVAADITYSIMAKRHYKMKETDSE